MAESSSLDTLIEKTNDPKFVKSIHDGVDDWVTWYRGRLDAIAKLNDSRTSYAKFDELRELLAARAQLRKMSERSGIEKNPEVEERLEEIEKQLKGFSLTESDYQYADDVDKALAEIEADPNYSLTAGRKPNGFMVDHEELRHDTKCVLVALNLYCSRSSSKLLVEAPGRLKDASDPVGGILGPIVAIEQLSSDGERFRNIDAVIDSVLQSWEAGPASLRSPLTANDRSILCAMLALDASITKPESATEIVNAAIYRGDHKRAFKNLTFNKLVHSKQGREGGYWLTVSGEALAKKL